MSGPKVVRIVTVEEVREICRGHLARLDAAIARWEKVCRRNDAVTDADVQAMHNRRAEIEALITKERYLELQKRAPEEIQWIESDVERRLEVAARRIADARVRARRRSTLAAELLQRTTLSAAERRDLEAVARSDEIDGPQAEAILGKILRSAAPAGPGKKDATLHALAQRLSSGLKGESLDDWLAAHSAPDEIEATSDKIDAAIAGLAVVGAELEAIALSARYKAILAEPASSTRKMRSDSLLLDVARTLDRHREAGRLLFELEQTLAEARAAVGDVHAPLLAEAYGVVERKDFAAALAVRGRLSDAIDAHRKAEAAVARRRAILMALTEVGYEAHEGMDTAKPADGRLLLRRATNPEMGVEIAGGAASSRVQMRPIRFAPTGSVGDSGKDRDIETIWCSDFDTLNDRLRALDASIAIERATPIGATPVMVVEEASNSDARRPSEATLPRSRTT